MNTTIKIFPTPQALAESLALELVNLINDTNTESLPFTIALSGGNTPKLLFSIIGDQYANFIKWNKVHFFWVDERCVPPDDPESNFGMTQKSLLGKIDITIANIHRIRGENDFMQEAERYTNEMNNFTVKKNGLPFFNIVLLGLGEDGHTASVFPGNEKLFFLDKICTTIVHPITGQKRITITGKVINNASKIIFLVTGRSKARLVKNIIGHGDKKKQFPASYVIPVDGSIFWYLDEESGSLLKQG